jgi:hypothetical protein
MAEGAPIEQAETFLKWSLPFWRAVAYDADQNPHELTYRELRALVDQVRLDDARLSGYAARVAELQQIIADAALEEAAQ